MLHAAAKRRALRHYARIAEGYHHRVARGPLLAHLRRRERAAVLQFARLTPGLSLADVGCGTGFYALEAKRVGMRVCAMDAVPEMLSALQGLVDEVRVRDLEALADSGAYDRVICAGVLDFVADPERAFANLCALVAVGGRLVVLAPRRGPGGWLYRVEKLCVGLRVNLYEVEWLISRARQHGLRVTAVGTPLPGNMVIAADRP
jgi:2-polyprenyl-3-methyl-5-hydroxy-6-metoxy-1,4-benzoquinol methylase